MEYDKDKVDEVTLALMYLVMSRTPAGGRAWRGFDAQTLERLHQKGWIGDPAHKSLSIEVTDQGLKMAEEFFKKYFQVPAGGNADR